MHWIQSLLGGFVRLGRAIVASFHDMNNNHSLPIAAGLSYYFLLSLFPALILAGAILAYLPIPNLFDRVLDLIARMAPPESMALIRRIVASVLRARHGGLISLGLLATLWSASGGFTAIMDGLNNSYQVSEKRPMWHTRLLGVGLTFLIGGLTVTALALMIVGPHFGEWAARHLHLAAAYSALWPTLRWGISVSFVVLAVELLYYLAPNVRQRFRHTILGAVVAVAGWMGSSYLLGIYLRNYANYNKTYGSLGAVIALMLWFYISGIALLFGAELNAEFLKACGQPPLQMRDCGPKKLPLKEAQSPEEKKAA